MIQGFRGREGGYTEQGWSRVLEGGRIHTAGVIPGFRGREGGWIHTAGMIQCFRGREGGYTQQG